MRRWVLVFLVTAVASSCSERGGDAPALPSPSPAVPVTVRVSVDSAGAQATGTNGNSYTYARSISSDGSYVAFDSYATNLVAGDTNGLTDVFVRDRILNTTTRVSVNSAGAQATGTSAGPSISSDARYVAFFSDAWNLVAGDTNGFGDVFVRDRSNNTTTRISVNSAGAQATGGASYYPSVSSDGRYVAFSSGATNLVAGDTNGLGDVFVRDRTTLTTTRVSVDSAGTQATGGASYYACISSNGRYVAFSSGATNLVASDTNGLTDVFVHDTILSTTTRVSLDSAGAQATGGVSGEPSISSDGRYVAFSSGATNLVAGDTNGLTDAFVRDTILNTTTRVSVDSAGAQATGGVGGGASDEPSISSDGRYVAFSSLATNLVAGDTNGLRDVFVRDRTLNTTTRVSVYTAGAQASDWASDRPAISSDGRYVAFSSGASNLVAGDTNGMYDAFVRGPLF